MNKLTQEVVVAAKKHAGEASELQEAAARTLKAYFVYTQPSPRSSSTWTEAMVNEYWAGVNEMMLRTVQKVWADRRMRQHIGELAALHRLTSEIYRGNQSFHEFQSIVVTVGNELGVWEKWPMLHNVHARLPLPAAAVREIQAGQLYSITQRNNAALGSFMYQQQAIASANYWNNQYWNNRYWNS